MTTYRKVLLTLDYDGNTPRMAYDVIYTSGERATGTADRAFAMQLVSQFYPNEMSLLQAALYPVAQNTTPTTPSTSTPTTSTTTTVTSTTVPGTNLKVGL